MATCIKPLAAYVCSNATGTTCTKLAFSGYVSSVNTTCATGEFAVLTPLEYAKLNTAITGQTADAAAIAAQSTTVAGQAVAVSTLQTQMNAVLAGAVAATTTTKNPDPEMIQAEMVLFGAVFVAGAVIWGLKQVLATFRNLGADSV